VETGCLTWEKEGVEIMLPNDKSHIFKEITNEKMGIDKKENIEKVS